MFVMSSLFSVDYSVSSVSGTCLHTYLYNPYNILYTSTVDLFSFTCLLSIFCLVLAEILATASLVLCVDKYMYTPSCTHTVVCVDISTLICMYLQDVHFLVVTQRTMLCPYLGLAAPQVHAHVYIIALLWDNVF